MSSSTYIRTGTAIIEVERIRKSQNNKRFLSNFFSADEIRFFVQHKLNPKLMAENYCVKIAVAKAIGTGMRVIRARDISVLRDRLGSPVIILDGIAKQLEQREGFEIDISVASCRDYATASVVIHK
ncbi:MAG: 4'-phosphopantetheinyl transferase superfamily protein [Oscillospiraceae bacterium]|nr:4'-phosphopantetheinyl transferase superfamily protein [Oscillospiraceae bacterium]